MAFNIEAEGREEEQPNSKVVRFGKSVSKRGDSLPSLKIEKLCENS
jgi:hypothetical protein